MKLIELKCSNCGAVLEIEDGVDTFYCKYCGSRIVVEGQSNATIEAKVKLKDMEHKEKLKNKQYDQERYKMVFKEKVASRNGKNGFIGLVVMMLISMLILIFGNAGSKNQNEELQLLVDEIMIDIENENYDDAYIKANLLYWDDSYSSEGEEKWDSTRESILEVIVEAEKESKK
jgi:DNA-directed RNA polymerase subunit RPC12/RpoP